MKNVQKFFFEKCEIINSNVYGKSSCKLKRCCKYGKKGDFERLIQCKDGDETCSTEFFEDFVIIKTNEYCSKGRTCYYKRIGRIVTKLRCKDHKQICAEYLKKECKIKRTKKKLS